MKRTSRLVALTAATLVLLAGTLAVSAQETSDSSGFLTDYSLVAPDPEDPEARLVYQDPSYAVEDFDKLYLEDLAFVVYPQDASVEFSREKVARILYLQNRFSEILRKALKKEGVRVVEEGGPGVLHCRWAVTNLGRTRISADLVPQTREMSAFTSADHRGVAFESECLDGASGEPVFIEIEAVEGGARKTDLTTWAGVEDRLEQDAEDAASNLVSVTKKKRRGSQR